MEKIIKRRVRVGKIDLDTCGAAFLLGVSRADEVEILSCEASSEDLADPAVICIEVGMSGETQLNNWDHHGVSKDLPSATKQVWVARGEKEEYSRLVEYIDLLDRKGIKSLGTSLADIFAGMLLITRDPVEQLFRGVEMLREVVHRGIDPFGLGRMSIEEIPGWSVFAAAKAENNRQVAAAVKEARWATTVHGRRMAYLETDFYGAPGALYEVGAEIVVVFSRHYGPNHIGKFTVAGNGIRVDAVLPDLNAREAGWGGPATGTIIGSPRQGSILNLEEVVDIVRRIL